MERNRLKWYGHIMGRIPKKMLKIKFRGRRPRGRPRTKWMDQVERYGKEREEMNAGETRQRMGRQGQM
jgi:hypothetical protein